MIDELAKTLYAELGLAFCFDSLPTSTQDHWRRAAGVVIETLRANPDFVYSSVPLTNRDHFAMAALPAVIEAVSSGRHMVTGDGTISEKIARNAYVLGDAMMKVRNENSD